MAVVRYLALVVACFVASAVCLTVLYLPVVAWAHVAGGSPDLSDFLLYCQTAVVLLLPGAGVFSLVAPVFIVRDVSWGWWHLIAPLCFATGTAFWVGMSLVEDDPKSAFVTGQLSMLTLLAVLAAALGGSFVARWIGNLNARVFRS